MNINIYFILPKKKHIVGLDVFHFIVWFRSSTYSMWCYWKSWILFICSSSDITIFVQDQVRQTLLVENLNFLPLDSQQCFPPDLRLALGAFLLPAPILGDCHHVSPPIHWCPIGKCKKYAYVWKYTTSFGVCWVKVMILNMFKNTIVLSHIVWRNWGR